MREPKRCLFLHGAPLLLQPHPTRSRNPHLTSPAVVAGEEETAGEGRGSAFLLPAHAASRPARNLLSMTK